MHLAISMNVWVHPEYGEKRDTISQDWISYLLSLWPGVTVLPVPNQPNEVERWADSLQIDGVIFSNGNNWGEAPERDKTEESLLSWCRAGRVPVLGVCRGLQAMNILLGGSIEKELSRQTGQQHAGVSHEICITDSNFQAMAGGERLLVNSYHNQGVTGQGLAKAVVPFAWGADEVAVEGFYHPEEALLAIQWHPERPNPSSGFDADLFRTFFHRGKFWEKTVL